MTRPLLFLLGAAVVGTVLATPLAAISQTDASGGQSVQKIAASICAACHGLAGNSTSPLFPKLAGQNEAYLATQLRAFKAKTRGEQDAHDYMWGMAALVNDSTIDELAHYYASQKPAPGVPGNPELMARGKLLFENGDPKRSIVACATCHGKAAEGGTAFPRLAGQHSAYVARQLGAIQEEARASPVMHGVIKGLDPGEIRAIAEYVQSL
jgi:cytochrome c553